MANRTDRSVKVVKGTNPQYLVEKIIRSRIYDSLYWKESCFGLSAELVVDRGMELRYIGGIFGGNIKPTPFLCLSLKLLQIQPDKDIVIEFIQQEEFKYIRALGAMYIRLTFESVEIYKYLEPLYNDFRKLRVMDKMGQFQVIYMDEFVDHLMREERYCDIILPRLQKREALEELGVLEVYRSLLDEDLEKLSASESEEEEEVKEKPRLTSRRRSRSREREREHNRIDKRDDRDRERKEEKEREKERERERNRDKERDRGDREDRDKPRDKERDRNRDGRGDRDRDRDRGRDKDRERDRSRERNRSRDRKKDRRDDDDSRRKEKDRGGEKREKESKGGKKGDDLSISETNALRASLGLAPLK